MRKTLIFRSVTSLFIILLLLLSSIPVFAEGVEMPSTENATAVYLYNIENDRVICAKGMDTKLNPSSSVKIIAGLIAVERLADAPSATITVTAEMLSGVSGKLLKLKAGEVVTVESMLYAALCECNNDAMHVLAVHIAGSVSEFVKLMNERVKEIGAENTYYTNPTGLNDVRMYTTARDTAKIAMEAMKNQTYMMITSAVKYIMPATNKSDVRVLYNRNSLISTQYTTKYFSPYAEGLNAGSSSVGVNSVVTTGSRNGLTYLCIVMGATETDDVDYSLMTAKLLLNWVVTNYGYAEVISGTSAVCEIPVTLSSEFDYVTLVPKEKVTVFMNLSRKADLKIEHVLTSSSIEAPVNPGDEAGFVTVSLDDEILAKVPLVAQNAVSQNPFLAFMHFIKTFILNRIVIISLLVGGAIVGGFYWYQNKGRRGKGRKRSRYF